MRRRLLLVAALLPALGGCMAPTPATQAQTFLVFFTADSAALDENGQQIILQAAQAARANPSAPVRVRGFAAPDAGSPAFNSTLSRARAQNVADNLLAAGVPRGQVRVETRGAVPFAQMPTEARRVEVVVGS